MDKLVSILRPTEDGSKTFAAALAVQGFVVPPVSSEVEVYFDKRSLYKKYVTGVRSVRLLDITEEDIAIFLTRQMDPARFWKHLEKLYRGGLPGEVNLVIFELADKAPQSSKKEVPQYKNLRSSTNTSFESRKKENTLKDLLKLGDDSES